MLHMVLEVFLWFFGLCIGSFLNVVIYRLPQGLSIAGPSRSFCPRCRVGIAWYDNVPLLSWWLLGGRCRHCRQLISVQYPLVEALTALAFVLVYHLLCVAGSRADLGIALLPTDLPVVLAWLVLVAGLMACSAMDIVSYSVDVRITDVVLYAGIALHALWPREDILVRQAQTATAAAALAAGVVSILMLWWTVWRPAPGKPDEAVPDEAPAAEPGAGELHAIRLGGRFAVLVFIALVGWLIYAGIVGDGAGRLEKPIAAALLAIFAATVLAGGQRRAADQEIQTAIEEEQPRARWTAWREMAWLTPALAAGVVVFIALTKVPALAAGWSTVVGWAPGAGFVPLSGAVVAVKGAVIGAAAGWVLRIVFTLAFGREAFGVGDIYILAAAGAAAGWDIALLGLLLSVGIALAGWLLGLLLKSTVMIPFGPWLAIGFVLALWWGRPAHRIAETYWENLAYAWREQPQALSIIAGLMLVGTAAAIALARLVRRWVLPAAS